jgi:hypothetical protein
VDLAAFLEPPLHGGPQIAVQLRVIVNGSQRLSQQQFKAAL